MNEMETDAQKVLQMEAEAILDLIPRIDEHFDAAVEMINSGRFIHIEKTEVKEIPLKEGESSFSADYW